MIFFCLYLVSGLVFHKVVWIVMKRCGQAGAIPMVKSHPPHVLLARQAKLMILVLISIQVFVEDVFPMLNELLPVLVSDRNILCRSYMTNYLKEV